MEGFVDASKAGSSAIVGGFLGDLGWNRGDVEIDECQANVNLTSSGVAGGFVGDASMYSDGAKDFAQRDISLTIKNSTSTGMVTSTEGAAGGFVGAGYRGTYESCKASGEVKGAVAGGFWGEVVPSPYVGSGNDTDVAHDIVIKNSTGADVVYGTKDAGGLIGKANTTPAKSEDGSTKGSKTEVSVDGSTPSKVVAGGKDASLSASVNYTNAESDKGNVKIKDSTGTSATLAPVVPKDDGFVVPDGGATGKDANGKEVKVPAGTLITEDGDVRAPLKLSSSSAKIVAGQSTSFTFTYGGSGNAEVTTSDDKVATVTVKDGAVTVVGVKEGEADITVSFPADGIYSATSATFKVTVTRKSTGGNGGGTVVPTPTKYKVDVADAENGTVKADKSSAAKGDKVTLTATAAEGYRASAVTVTDASGKAVSLTLDADGTYSFEMPASDVKVVASFVKQEAKAFPDVDQSAWYAKGVAFVSSKGIMGGYPDGTFGVGKTLTRAEFAQLLYKRAGGVDDKAAENETGMADVADSEWYTAAANWAVANGVINGYGNADGTRTFGPNDAVTLEQMVAIIANLEKADVAKADASVLGRFVDPGDVSPWFTQSVAWAVQAGLVNGSSEADGLHIRPKDPIARERVASVIMNAYDKGVLK